jgi:hypothetical protein
VDSKSDTDKKYFDVAKPRNTQAAGAPVVKNSKRQMINIIDDKKPPEETSPKSNSEDDTKSFDDTLMDQPEASVPATKPLSHPDLDVPVEIEYEEEKPDDTDKQDEKKPESTDEGKPFVDPLPGTIEKEPEPPKKDDPEPAKEETEEVDEASADQKTVQSESSEQAVKKAEPDEPASSTERFATTDALPEASQPATDEAKDEMQDPKIYDTKEYYVPIGNSYHSHGGLKMAFAFGILCAVIVVGAIVYYMLKIGK